MGKLLSKALYSLKIENIFNLMKAFIWLATSLQILLVHNTAILIQREGGVY